MLGHKFQFLRLAAFFMGLSSCAHPSREYSDEYPVIDLSSKVLENGEFRDPTEDETAAALAIIVTHHARIGESVRIGLFSLRIGESWSEFYNNSRTLESMIVALLPKDAASMFSRRTDDSLSVFKADIRQEVKRRREGLVYVTFNKIELLSDGGVVCNYSTSESSGAFDASKFVVSADRETVTFQPVAYLSGNPGALDSILIHHLDRD